MQKLSDVQDFPALANHIYAKLICVWLKCTARTLSNSFIIWIRNAGVVFFPNNTRKQISK
jgi:hypothetical protein